LRDEWREKRKKRVSHPLQRALKKEYSSRRVDLAKEGPVLT
jgi:hypothetical protein